MAEARISPEAHAASVTAWRARRDVRLRAPDGWLSLVGLHWLSPGENRFGAHPANEIVLGGEQVPPRAGSLHLIGDRVQLHPSAEALLADGQPATSAWLRDDANGEREPTILELGSLRMHLIRRAARIGLRVRDRSAPSLAAFAGMRSFGIDPGWRVVARLERAAASATLPIADIIGDVSDTPTPGDVVFEREGETYRLAALDGDDGTLWLIFADATTGAQTYAGGRYLYTEPVAPDGSVVVDFNLAYNPPCVFSPYATCPLPPMRNRLPIAVEAGELTYPPA